MKNRIIAIIALSLTMTACATTGSMNTASDDMSAKPKTETVTPPVSEEAPTPSCQEGDPGYPRCTTGGGATSGPILND